MNFMFTLELVF